MKSASRLAACAALLALCLSTCISPRPYPDAVDPAVVEAEIAKAQGIELAKRDPLKEPLVEPDREPLIALAEPPKEPDVPKPEPPKPAPKEPEAPKPEPPKPPEPVKEPEAPRPEPPKEPDVPKPEPPKEPEAPKPEPPKPPEPVKEPEAPKPEPPREPETPQPPEAAPALRAGGLCLFPPQQRKAFVAGETAEFTLVLLVQADLPNAAVTLTLTNEAGTTWKATDQLGLLSAGRHSVTYGVDAACFPPGAYKLTARVGEQETVARELVVGPAIPRTHFPLVGWPQRAPKAALDAQRWSHYLGLNTVLVQDRSGWGSDSTQVADVAFAATSRGIAADSTAEPMEAAWTAPPFVQVADHLSAAGLQWLNACAVSGGRQGSLLPDRDVAFPEVVLGAHMRIHQRLQAERRFRNCVGIHFTDQALLTGPGAAEANPLGAPGPIAAYKKLYNVADVPWLQGSQRWDDWFPFMRYRAGILGDCLASWAAAARAVDPRLIATSSLHSPTQLADGVYPPLQVKGLPVITARASLTGPAGMMMPAVVADLARAGHLGKRLWLQPELADDADLDEVRTAIFMAVARKIDGVVYPQNLDYHADRPALGPAALDLQPGVRSINDTLARLGDFLLALQKPRDDVAIFYSLTEHIDRIGRDPAKNPQAAAYPWTLIAAHAACVCAHFPATFLTEDELLAEKKPSRKVILVIGLNRILPEVKAKLEAHIAAGAVVLTDLTTKAEIQGARPLGLEFPDIHRYDADLLEKAGEEKLDATLERRDIVVQGKLLYPLLGQLRTELKQHIDRDYTASDPDILVCHQTCGRARYVFVVNNTQRTDLFRGLKWELAAARTRVTLRDGDYTLYEAMASQFVYPQREKGHPTLTLILPPGGMRIYALMPEPIRGVRIRRASLGRDGLSLAAYVYGDARTFLGRKPMDAAVPLEITLTAPSGRERLRFYRAHTPGGYSETVPFARFAEPGRWTVQVRELLSNQKASTTFRVGTGSAAWVRRRGALAVFGGDRIRDLLRSDQPLLVIAGTEDEAAKAEALAAALRTEQRQVEVRLAADLAKPRALAGEEAIRYISAAPGNAPMPDIRQPAILLGELATHPLLQVVHGAGVLPRTVTPDYPGPAGALLCPVVSAFEPDVEVVVAAASDAAGVDRAIEALAAAGRGAAPRVAWRSVSTTRPAPPPKTSRRAQVKRLAPDWEYRGTDIPTCLAAPLRSSDFTIGFYDGTVVNFSTTGKQLWTRRCTTRTRAATWSLDGLWASIASFPELLLLTAQGRLQFAVALEESSPRADHTAVVIAPDGTLTVAGTRRGTVFAYDLQGNKVFTFGDVPPPEGEEAKPARLGCVNALAISPKSGAIVAGGELGTLAVDTKGEELWASADLSRVTSLAASLGEEQTIAVGSRTGLVACVTGGTVLWRNQADGYVTSVCFRGTTQELLAASLDGTLTCYDKDGKALWTRRSPVGFRFVATSLDGASIAAAEAGGRVLLLNKVGQVVAETEPVDGAISAFTFTADGQRLVVGTTTNDVVAFRLKRARVDEDEL